MNYFQNKFPEIYQLIFENSSRAMVIARNNKLEIVNKAFVTLFGYKTIEELIGISANELIEESSLNIIRERKEARLRGEVVNELFHLNCKKNGGEIFPCEVEVNFFILDGEQIFF